MQWQRPETCVGRHGMPRTPLARPGPSRTSPRTNSARPPTRSRPHALARRKARARAQGGSSAGGSVTSSRRRFASSSLTTSGCATTSAGRCLTVERTRVTAPAYWQARVLLRRELLTKCPRRLGRPRLGEEYTFCTAVENTTGIAPGGPARCEYFVTYGHTPAITNRPLSAVPAGDTTPHIVRMQRITAAPVQRQQQLRRQPDHSIGMELELT